MKNYILYGAVKSREKIVNDYVARQDGGAVIGWVDSNPAKWNDAEKIFSPDLIKNYPDAAVVIMSDKIKAIAKYIRSKGYKNEILVYPGFRYPCFWNFSDDEKILNDWCKENQQKIIDIYQKDSYTQKLLKEFFAERLAPNFEFIPIERMVDFSRINLYFYDRDIAPKGDLTYVNAGAYDGDTIEEFYLEYGDRLKKVYAFEPDSQNMANLEIRMQKLNLQGIVEKMPFGLYDADKTLFFKASASQESFIIDEGDVSIEVRKLDSVISEVKGTLCVNMDIEGSEIPALDGMKETIKKYRPYLAICIYHKLNDVLAVPMKIKEICSDYDFYIRCGAHMECYAVPK